MKCQQIDINIYQRDIAAIIELSEIFSYYPLFLPWTKLILKRVICKYLCIPHIDPFFSFLFPLSIFNFEFQ